MKTIKNYKPRKYGDSPIAFFHYMEDGKIKYQGHIAALNKDRSGICQLYDWFTGGNSDEINVTRAFFDDCIFFDSDYGMRQHKDKK